MLTRRQFIGAGAAATGVVALSGMAGLRVWDSSTLPEAPDKAWREARGVDRMILAAALAPSSHNTQPWRFRSSAESLDLLADPKRTMGAADPRLRELHVSMGCALENAVIAADEQGMRVAVEQVAGTPGAHFARLKFSAMANEPSASRASLASAIPARRTNRAPYDPEKSVGQPILDELSGHAQPGVRVVWLTSPEVRARFTALSTRATEAHIADEAMQRDSHRWYRMRRGEADLARDGITVRGANLPPAISLLMGLVPPTPESFDEGWAKATRETHCGTAPAFGLLVVQREGDRGAWVDAGRTYQRMQLAATQKGFATHPISQALAVRDREVDTGAAGPFSAGLQELGGAGEVVLAFRIGVPTREQLPSLRRQPVLQNS